MWQLLRMYSWLVWHWLKPDETGQGQTEYMILLSLAVLVVLVAIVALGFTVYKMWDEIITALPF